MAEKGLALKRMPIEMFGEFDLRLGVKGVADVPQLFRLFTRRRNQGRMTVAQNRSAKPGE